jgi:hypothetical protein
MALVFVILTKPDLESAKVAKISLIRISVLPTSDNVGSIDGKEFLVATKGMKFTLSFVVLLRSVGALPTV